MAYYNNNGGGYRRWEPVATVHFVNPYTFVPLPQTPPRRLDPAAAPGQNTGWLDCTLTVKTPLAIPATELMQEENGHKRYPFYRVEGKLGIPGSSLRGMLRSLYETATGSCLGHTPDTTYLVKGFQNGHVVRSQTQNSLYALLGGPTGFAPCTDPACLCPACRLFGMVGKTGGYGGKLRVGPAVCTAENPAKQYRTLPPLGAPKPKATEFYLTPPQGPTPNTAGKGTLHAPLPPDTAPWTADRFRPVAGTAVGVRGRKFYWHHEPRTQYQAPTKLNNTLELALPDTTFTFKVYFDALTDAELNGLLWCLTLGENTPDSHYRQMLGHGKPLGYGSVKITVQTQTLRSVGAAGYKLAPKTVEPEQAWPFGATVRPALQRVLDCTAMQGENVCYPLGEARNTAGFQWFVGNRYGGKIRYALPEVTDATQRLPKLKK